MSRERLYYVDWLRVAVILSLVPYHAALTFTGLGDTYIITPVRNLTALPFLVITASLDSYFMTLLFFLSGISTFYALQFRSKKQYIHERLNKLAVPLGLGLLLLCPVQAYFKGLKEGFKGNFLQFIPEFFSGKIVYYSGYAHLWFLLYLFVFSVACAPLFKKWLEGKGRLDKISTYLCKGKNIYWPILYVILVEIVLRPFFPGRQTLIMDWANDILYLSVFIFGFVFASDAGIRERLSTLWKASVFITAFCVLAMTGFYFTWSVLWLGSVWITFLWTFTKGLYECFAIIFLVGLGSRYFNKKSPVLDYLSKASFPYYIWHYLPVVAFTYLFLSSGLNMYVRYMAVVILSYVFMAVIYELAVRRLALYRKRRSLQR